MDFSFMSRAEKMLRPSCIPWEVHGPVMSEGRAAIHYFSHQGQKCSDAQHAPAAIHL